MRFPSLEARIEHTKTLQKIGWLDAVEAFTLLGTSDAEPEEVNIPNPIYKLWVVKTNPAAAQYQLTKGLEAAMWEKHNAVYEEVGGKNILLYNSYWCNEAYPFFGISVYPSVEANMKVMQTLDELGWRSFLDVSITLLGIPQ